MSIKLKHSTVKLGKTTIKSIKVRLPNSELKAKIKQCNVVNSEIKDGVGNTSDNVAEKQTFWKYNRVNTTPFKLLDNDIEYNIIHAKLRTTGRPLVVIPGYSDKSICWTIGEMNRYVKQMPECFQKFNEIYLINLENVKPIQEKNKNRRDEIDSQIAEHIDKILRTLKLTNISLLGRSAGGGICIHIAKNSVLGPGGDYVSALNLACPGYKKSGITDFINARMTHPIPIRFCWAIEDTTVPITEGYHMKQQLIDSGYIKQGADLLKFVELSTNSNIPAVNHRVHKELIYMLV